MHLNRDISQPIGCVTPIKGNQPLGTKFDPDLQVKKSKSQSNWIFGLKVGMNPGSHSKRETTTTTMPSTL